MKPWHLWTLYRRADRVADLMQEATVKSLWRSKTLWFNLLSAVLEVMQLVTQYQLIPPGISTVIVNVINIGLRMVTYEGVTLRSE